MPDHTSPLQQEEVNSHNPSMSLKERRKWDRLFVLVIFVIVLLASVLFNVITESEPLMANKGF